MKENQNDPAAGEPVSSLASRAAAYEIDADMLLNDANDMRNRAATLLSMLGDTAPEGDHHDEWRASGGEARRHIDFMADGLADARRGFRAAYRPEYDATDESNPSSREPEIDTSNLTPTRTDTLAELADLRADLYMLGKDTTKLSDRARDEQWPESVPEIDEHRPERSPDFGTHINQASHRLFDAQVDAECAVTSLRRVEVAAAATGDSDSAGTSACDQAVARAQQAVAQIPDTSRSDAVDAQTPTYIDRASTADDSRDLGRD